jgi:hypothetical protein
MNVQNKKVYFIEGIVIISIENFVSSKDLLKSKMNSSIKIDGISQLTENKVSDKCIFYL